MTHVTLKMKQFRNNITRTHKIFITLLFISIGVHDAYSQQAGRNNSAASANSRDTGKVADIREKLVQLAMQNPMFEIADRRVAIADYDLKRTKGRILGIVSGQYN